MTSLESIHADLKAARLVVSGDKLQVSASLREDALVASVREDALVASIRQALDERNRQVEPRPDEDVADALKQKISEYLRTSGNKGESGTESVSSRGGPSFGQGAGRLHKSLHKTLHKSLHKGLHKSLHKGLGQATDSSMFGSGLSWPTIEVPWRELSLLYKAREKYRWDRLEQAATDLLPPPSPEQRMKEASALLIKQDRLRDPDQKFRRDRIRLEAGNDLTAYMVPLGADVTSPGGATAVMFQTILWLGSLIGLMYKARFNAVRPHVLNNLIEPYIPVPAFSSYPSNHAFQSFLIAEVFCRALPEHQGGAALYRAATEVAGNREWAGLHVASDTEAGKVLARLLGPMMEDILADHIRAVRAEWMG